MSSKTRSPDINQSKSALLKIIKPKYIAMYDEDEYQALLEDVSGPGGVDRLRTVILDHDWFAPFNKGGLAKKKKSKPKSNKGSIDYRKTGMFYGGMAKKR